MDMDWYIYEKSGVTPKYVEAHVRAYIKKFGVVPAVFIDYVQKMRSSDRTNGSTARVESVSNELQIISKNYGVPMFLLAQLNRELEKRPDKRPTVPDIKQSGELEQDADFIFFIHRPVVYDDSFDDPCLAEIIIAKNREGSLGKIKYDFDGPTQTFKERNF